jgi:hypothetical protein
MTRALSFRTPAFGTIWPDIAAFAIGLGTAWYLNWKTTDLVWSLWLCSLVLGYLTIVSTIASGVYLGIKTLAQPEFPKKYRLPAILIGAVVALFFLGFFSIHFCGFHAIHAVFLSVFFPLNGANPDSFGMGFMNPFLLWKSVFIHLIPVYGIFLVPTIMAERHYVFGSFISVLETAPQGLQKSKVVDFFRTASEDGTRKSMRDPFTRPYVNVIRMHILIFFFAFAHMAKVDSFFVYTVVYAVYFFPWKAFRTPR